MKLNKGITLIALIITIIILLILAAISIDIAIDGKLFDRAQETVGEANNKLGEEQNRVDGLINEWDNLETGTNGGTTTIPTEENHDWTRHEDILICANCNAIYTIGEKVKYTPETHEAVVVNGISIPQETGLGWAVLGIEDNNNDGINETLLITSATPTTSKVNTDEDTLNDICKNLYSNTQMETEARAMNVDDINILVGYVPTGGFLGDNAVGSIYYKIEGFKTLREIEIYEYIGYEFSEEELDMVLNSYSLKLTGNNLTECCENPESITITNAERNLIFGENNEYQYKLASTATLLDSNTSMTTGLGVVYNSYYSSRWCFSKSYVFYELR